MLIDPDEDTPFRKQGPTTAAPLSAKQLLERARLSSWKSCGHVRIVVLMDGDGGDRVDNALAFRHVHGNDEETHQDALACFADAGLAVAAAGNNGGMTRVSTFTFVLVPKKGLQSSAGGP